MSSSKLISNICQRCGGEARVVITGSKRFRTMRGSGKIKHFAQVCGGCLKPAKECNCA